MTLSDDSYIALRVAGAALMLLGFLSIYFYFQSSWFSRVFANTEWLRKNVSYQKKTAAFLGPRLVWGVLSFVVGLVLFGLAWVLGP